MTDAKFLHKINMEMKLKNKKEQFSDFRGYGIGIVSYFKIIYSLIITFCVLTLIMVPTIGIYSSKKIFTSKKFYTTPTLGNLG